MRIIRRPGPSRFDIAIQTMNRIFALIPAGMFMAAGLCAQARADFEASVKAAMAPSIAQQRSAIQKQVSTLGAGRSAAAHSFFTTPFSTTTEESADCDALPAGELNPIIEEAAQKTGVDVRLVRAVIEQESAGRPCALSARGAQGLMQLMPATAEEYDVDDPFDPKQNVEAGTKLLRSLLERYRNDPSLALGAYNAGAGRVDQAGGIPPIPETVDYVSAILEKLGSLAARAGPTDTNDQRESTVTSTKNSGWQTLLPSLKDF
jgi:soluble lytic murein transglycosylase-like protein